MILFPTDTDFSVITQNQNKSDSIGRSIAFNFDEKKFSVIDGFVKTCGGIEAVRQWVQLLLRTRPGKYKVYGKDFGVSTHELIGNKSLPSGYVWSEIKREILEGLALNPAIETADNFQMERLDGLLKISFTLYLKSGESTEVNAVV